MARLMLVVLVMCTTRYVVATDFDELDKSTQSAIFLLRMSAQVHYNGKHHLLQRALRQLRDPSLIPLFSAMAESPHAELQIHGILGLAECSPARKLDLAHVVAIKSPPVQADLISHAMDRDLLTNEQALQLLTWQDGVDTAVKTLAAAPLIRDGQFDNLKILHQTLETNNLARRSLAALLLLQLGDPDAVTYLAKLDASSDPQRDSIRTMLLSTTRRFEFHEAGPWSLKIANDPDAGPAVRIAAMETALHLGASGVKQAWHQRFESNHDTALRTRLALIALRHADQLSPEFAEPMLRCDVPLLRQIGATATAISIGSQIAENVSKLLDMNHSIVNEWALWYVTNRASDSDANKILTKFILGYNGLSRKSAMKLDKAVAATKIFFERDPVAATRILRPILSSGQTPWPLKKGILFGLIRCKTGSNASKVIEGLEPFERSAARSLGILLLAKHSSELPMQQLRDLGLLVRGGGNLRSPLRLQAAWRYLALTNQIDTALNHVLNQ